MGLSFGAQAHYCVPQVHSDIVTEEGNVIVWVNSDRFTINDQGGLKVGPHPVSLNAEQQETLATYHSMVLRDLPYVRSTLSNELSEIVRRIDGTLATELGSTSRSRRDLAMLHQQLEVQLVSALGVLSSPQLNHQEVKRITSELDSQVNKFIARVSASGISDLAMMDVPQGQDRMTAIAERLSEVEANIRDTVAELQPRLVQVNSQVCERLEKWQQQEQKIQSQIPALSTWQSVTLTAK
uniref:DUF2884 family protein n=1 Tax=Thaumasiovibrio occultus TaxID=1891184 RepID=UPI00131B1571|nr:DUF2884 family protein [Thaumasiovibrio occultus]